MNAHTRARTQNTHARSMRSSAFLGCLDSFALLMLVKVWVWCSWLHFFPYSRNRYMIYVAVNCFIKMLFIAIYSFNALGSRKDRFLLLLLLVSLFGLPCRWHMCAQIKWTAFILRVCIFICTCHSYKWTTYTLTLIAMNMLAGTGHGFLTSKSEDYCTLHWICIKQHIKHTHVFCMHYVHTKTHSLTFYLRV